MAESNPSSQDSHDDVGVEYRNKIYARMTPEERTARFHEMMERAWEILMANPEGYEQFKRRNYHERGHRDPKKYRQPL